MRRLLAVIVVLVASLVVVTSPLANASHEAATPNADTALSTLGVGHVFVIVLENESYKHSYVDNPHPYLGKTLPAQGTLLTHYYAIGHNSLDNYLAILSGQAPDSATSHDCAKYKTFKPTTHPVTINSDGQALGTGCVYPAQVSTLANQLTDANVTWGGYMDHMGTSPKREEPTCGVPKLTNKHIDDTQNATRRDQYAARHNPFVYFDSLVDSGLCAQNVVPLGALPAALGSVSTTPQFTWITPDLCNDGHDSPCKGTDSAGSSKGGLASIDHFLRKWVPTIQASPAYQDDGLIIITSDESEGSDATSCCGEMPGPNEPQPGIRGPGGGRIGTLVVGKCVAAGAKDPADYNHYSLLRSLEDLYGVTTGGTDGIGHLGYAAADDLAPFGTDLFNSC